MSKKKKLVVGFISISVTVLAIVGIALGVRQANAQVIPVIPVSSLQQDYYNSEQSAISGEVTTHVTQKVNLENDSIVSEVYVKVGDRVKEGDRLLSYDMTLTELELQLERLTKENNENKLEEANARLTSLENGGPIEENTRDEDGPSTGLGEGDVPGDEASVKESNGMISVSAFKAVSVVSNVESELPGTESNAREEVIPEQETEETISPIQPSPEPAGESNSTAYGVLDFDSQPYAGTGTAQDPYRYLCDETEEYVTIQGSFLNKMAGYDATGENKISQDGPFWYRLEFHENNTVADINNPQNSLIGYYARKGGSEPSDPSEEKRFSVEGAGMSEEGTQVLTPPETPDSDLNSDEEIDDTEEEYYEDDGYLGEDDSAISREDAIKSQKNTVEELELAIKSNEIQISKLEKKLNNRVILSTIDGIVKVVGDPITGESDGDAFIEIDSDDGLYVRGAISELELEEISIGQTLSVFSYESGQSFQAEIKEISQFPANSNEYYTGMGNPNVSYYPFMAKVLDEPEISNGESVEMTLNTDEDAAGGLYMDAAFVRTEEGQDFVYKDDNGRLAKQIVQTVPTADGYAIKIEKGISVEDKIAFPYGKGVKEGAKTKEGTLDEVYGYY